MRKPRIYVSGPMAGAPGSNYLANIRQGIEAAEALERIGAVPYLPHTNCLWGLLFPGKDYETVIKRDLAWVEACDALVRIPGQSKGADEEVNYALSKQIPVFDVWFEVDMPRADVLVYSNDSERDDAGILRNFIENFRG